MSLISLQFPCIKGVNCLDDKIKWQVIDYMLGGILAQVSETDYPTLYEKVASAKGDVNALWIAAIDPNAQRKE